MHYKCRNMTMSAFTAGLHDMMFASLGNNPILDKTEMKGGWNFDLHWSGLIVFAGNTTERISFQEAVEKQMGMKLEEIKVPTPVIVIDSVNRKTKENPPGTSEALPPIPLPTEFEVADVKPS